MRRSCLCLDQSGSVAVACAVALMMRMGVAAAVRALALPGYTALPAWNKALAAAGATVQGNIAAGALLTDFNAANHLHKRVPKWFFSLADHGKTWFSPSPGS